MVAPGSASPCASVTEPVTIPRSCARGTAEPVKLANKSACSTTHRGRAPARTKKYTVYTSKPPCPPTAGHHTGSGPEPPAEAATNRHTNKQRKGESEQAQARGGGDEGGSISETVV